MNVKIGCTMHFTAGFWWDNTLLMNNYTVTFKLLTVTMDHANQNIAVDRLKFMFEEVFTDMIFIADSEKDQIKKLKAAGLRLAILPEEPVDQIIGMMLYSKISAVMEGNVIIRSLMLSSTAGDNIIYEHDSEEAIAPFDRADWWTHSGPECEGISKGRDKVFVISPNKHWRDYGLEWSEQYADDAEESDENVLVFTDFKNDKDK